MSAINLISFGQSESIYINITLPWKRDNDTVPTRCLSFLQYRFPLCVRIELLPSFGYFTTSNQLLRICSN